MKNKLFSFLLFLVSIFLLVDAFTNAFDNFLILRKIVALVIICLAGILVYFSVITPKNKN